jgi:PAS domain-containing protein
MPNPATVRERRLRKTKAQLIDEIDTIEQRAAEKEAQLRVALDNMPGGMTVEDRDRNYVLFNSKYSELHGYLGRHKHDQRRPDREAGAVLSRAHYRSNCHDDGHLHAVRETQLIFSRA